MDRIADELRHDLETVLRELHRVLKALGDGAERLRDSAADAAEDLAPVRAVLEDAPAAIEERVKEHPWTSLVLAFLAGALVATLLRR